MIEVDDYVEELRCRHGASIEQIAAECIYLSVEQITEMVEAIDSGDPYTYVPFKV